MDNKNPENETCPENAPAADGQCDAQEAERLRLSKNVAYCDDPDSGCDSSLIPE
jgi:hypothetical protein